MSDRFRLPHRTEQWWMKIVGIVAASGWLSGCALNQKGEEAVSSVWERHQREQAERPVAYAQLPVVRNHNSHESASTRPAIELVAQPALRDYIAQALKHNPEILAAEETARAKAARIPQVTALPDPMLETKTLPEPVRTADGDNYFNLGLTQRIVVPEKLTRAGHIALEEARMAIAEWEQVRLQVIADVKRAYFRIYVIDRSVEITRKNQDLLRTLIESARAEVAAGRQQQGDVLRAQVELSNLEARVIELLQQRVGAVAMLNRLLNQDRSVEVPAATAFEIRQVDAKLDRLITQAAQQNPELARFERQIEREREAVELARLAYWPDFTLGFEWMYMEPRDAFEPPRDPQTGRRPVVSQMSENGGDSWAIMFGFSIPLWFEKNEAGIREARRRLNAAIHEYTSTKNMVEFRIEDALAKVRAQKELAELFDGTILPQARQAYEVARAGYTTGRTDFQYVIDNWQKWLMFEIQYHRALGELEASIADLEEAVGAALSDQDSHFAEGQTTPDK